MISNRADDPSFSTPTPAPSHPAVVARTRPPVTTALVGINVAVFAAMVLTGVSAVAPTTRQLLIWGANWGPFSLGPQPWRMLTSNYVHGGIIHIGLNMWCLWNLGYLAERIFDRWTYLLTYTACGLGGSLASLWLHPQVVGVGASGAIFGMAGASIAALYLGRLPIPKQALRGTLKSLVAFAGYNLFFGAVVPGIDNSAHIGGLVTGLALGALLAKHLTEPPEIRNQWRMWIFVAATLALFSLFTFVKHASRFKGLTH
jgi:rhomboid protease GluP